MRALYQLIVLHLASSERHDNARYHILFPLNKELSWQSLLQYHNKTDMISDLGPNARDFVKEIFVDSKKIVIKSKILMMMIQRQESQCSCSTRNGIPLTAMTTEELKM